MLELAWGHINENAGICDSQCRPTDPSACEQVPAGWPALHLQPASTRLQQKLQLHPGFPSPRLQHPSHVSVDGDTAGLSSSAAQCHHYSASQLVHVEPCYLLNDNTALHDAQQSLSYILQSRRPACRDNLACQHISQSRRGFEHLESMSCGWCRGHRDACFIVEPSDKPNPKIGSLQQ